MMPLYKIPLLIIFVLLIIFGGELRAQLIIDSVHYWIDIGDFKGLPDSIVKMPIQIKNELPIGGFIIRFEYDTTLLHPIRVGMDEGTSIVYDSVAMTGRGLNTINSFTTNIPPPLHDTTIYAVRAARDTADTINRGAHFVTLLPQPRPEPEPTGWHTPFVPIDTPTVSTILYFLFRVDHNAALGTSRFIQVKDHRNVVGQPQEYRINQFADTTGTVTIYPGTGTYGYGRFQVDSGSVPIDTTCPSGYHWCVDHCCPNTPGNNAPTIDAIVPSSYDIMQGDSVKFSVTARDVDGDAISLLASGLPQNATFSPSNPATGTGTVIGNFRFLPSFAQSGTFTIDFQATDEHAEKSSIRSVSIKVNVLDIDRLFTTSAYGGAPVGGIPGATPVILPIDLVTTKTVYGVQFDMSYPGSIVEIDSLLVTSRTPEYVVYENLGQFPDSVRVVTFGLSNEAVGPVDSASGSAILRAFLSIDTAAAPGDYWVRFYDAWESVDPNPLVPSLALLTDSGVVQVDKYGDVNLDKRINVDDLVKVVAYIIGSYGLPLRNFATADVVKDGMVNVVDLVGIINLIFGLPVNPSPAPVNYGDNFATLSVVHDDLSAGQLTKLNVRGEFPDDVAGVQLQIDYDPDVIELSRPEVSEAANQFTLAFNDDHNGRIRMVLYNHQPWKKENLIPAGLADVVRLPATVKQAIKADDKSKVRITQAFLSNSNANEIPMAGTPPVLPSTFMLYQNYPNPFNPTTRIDFDINQNGLPGGQLTRLKIYNILGEQVRMLVDENKYPGHYSVTWDGTDKNGRSVATGIYLYRLEVADKHQTKKMLLVK
jgi:FlgD Ig-like domain/Putative Ig domain/Dockerin type I domain